MKKHLTYVNAYSLIPDILKCMAETNRSWDVYRTFLCVLTEGSLSGAARALGLTQPTVGRHIDAMEKEMGFQLFTRSQYGLTPTDAALDLRPHAEALASHAKALSRAASGQANAASGSVRITASEAIGVEVLPAILASLGEQYPDIGIELMLSDAVTDLLRREADIAVRMTPPSQDALIVRKVGEVGLGLFAHRDYLARCGRPKSVAELKGHRIIGFDTETPFIRAFKKQYPKIASLDYAMKADSSLAQFAAIRAGVGIGICQVGIARRDVNLIRLLPGDFDVGLPTWVAMHENLKSTLRCGLVFKALVAGLQEYTSVGKGRRAVAEK